MGYCVTRRSSARIRFISRLLMCSTSGGWKMMASVVKPVTLVLNCRSGGPENRTLRAGRTSPTAFQTAAANHYPPASRMRQKSRKRRRQESNLLITALQAAAVPAGSSVKQLIQQMSSPGIEPGLRPSQGRVQAPPHSKTNQTSVPPPRIEPRLAASKAAVLPAHSQGK